MIIPCQVPPQKPSKPEAQTAVVELSVLAKRSVMSWYMERVRHWSGVAERALPIRDNSSVECVKTLAVNLTIVRNNRAAEG